MIYLLIYTLEKWHCVMIVCEDRQIMCCASNWIEISNAAGWQVVLCLAEAAAVAAVGLEGGQGVVHDGSQQAARHPAGRSASQTLRVTTWQ